MSNAMSVDWKIKETLEVFSHKAGRRWYEARQHLHRGVFISVLCCVGIICVGRVEYETDKDYRHVYVDFVFLRPFSKSKLLVKLKELPEKLKHKAKEPTGWYQTFLAGDNMVGDVYSGYYL
jgi:hypothetical protein